MRALRVVVVVMGVMIVAGIAVLAVTIAGRMAKPRGGTLPAHEFSPPAIDIPAGARIETMAVGPDRVVLDLVLKDGGRELVVIDLASGRKLGTVPLRTVP